MHDRIADMMHDLRASHRRATSGTWGKGRTTHETVATNPGREPYRLAEFRHADDAAFCDYAHAFIPDLLDELERLRVVAAIGETK